MRHLSKLFILFLATSLFVSCDKEEEKEEIKDTTSAEAILLPCDYFKEDRILSKQPNAEVDYIIDCVIQITDAVIQIEPGVVIHFTENSGIRLQGNGAISAKGNPSAPIVFTTKSGNKGSWRGIYINSPSTQNELSFCHILNAGGNSFNSNNDRGAIVFWANSKLKLHDCVINNSASHGLNAIYTKSLLDFRRNSFADNTLAPVKIDPEYIGAMDELTVFTESVQNWVEVSLYTSKISSPTTIHKLSVPYRFSPRGSVVFNFVVEAALTVNPGVRIEFEDGTGIRINENGSFKAEGTENDKIIFTSASNTAGSWRGLYFAFTQSPSNRLKHAVIEMTGTDKGAIYMWAKPKLTVTDCVFNDNDCVFYAAPNVSSPNINLDQSNNTSNNNRQLLCGD